MSRFNTLYLGEANDAAEELENSDEQDIDPTVDELRITLINALRRIDHLERQVASIRGESA